MARRINEDKAQNSTSSESYADPFAEFKSEFSSTSSSYHELSDFPIQEVNLLTQVQQQVDLLEEMIFRNSFLMKEVRYLLKK